MPSLLLLCAPLAEAALEDEIRAFEAMDAANPPPQAALLFVGSSTIRGWPNLSSAFPGHTVLNRGFGGSHMSDLLHYFDRIVAPYEPPLIVVYEGDNDIASGKSVDQVFADFTNFLARVRTELPGSDVAILSVKPSPSRAQYLPLMRELNERLQALADGSRLRYIDVFTPMLNASSQPRPELFQSDMLHMNAAGYALWKSVIGPIVNAWHLAQGHTFLIDFGSASSPATNGPAPNDPLNAWNNVSSVGTTTGGVLSNLVTVSDFPSPFGLVIIDRFNGANENGAAAAPVFVANATRDSLFGNTESFSGMSNIYPSFKLTSLDPALTYHFTFYASRMGASDNRETEYTITGANSARTWLDAANNISNLVSVSSIEPDSAGEITISLAPSTNNTSANHFTYLGVLLMEAVPPQTPVIFTRHPAGQSVTAYEPVSFSGAVAGARPYFIQWLTNGTPVPEEHQFTWTIPVATPEMDGLQVSLSVSNMVYGATSSIAVLTVTPDTNAPVLMEALSPDGGVTLELRFNESLAPEPAADAANYQVNGKPVISASLLPDGRTVRLTLGFLITGTFTVTVDGLEDLSGNTLATGTSTTGTISPRVTNAILIDFGGGSASTGHGSPPGDPTNFWNNVTESIGTSSSGVLPELITVDGQASGIGLSMLRRFNGANLNGTTSAGIFPPTATSDSLFGNTEVFNGLSSVFPGFQLTGLNPGRFYSLTFYASRMGVNDNRETGYTVVGVATNLARLNAANNITNKVVLEKIAPASSGEITISLAPTAANNNGNHFTYLGVLRVDPHPVTPHFTAPKIENGRILLDWNVPALLEWAPAIGGPWAQVIPPPVPPYSESLEASQNRFFRLRNGTSLEK